MPYLSKRSTVFTKMNVSIITKSGKVKEGYTFYKEFINKIWIKLSKWSEAKKDSACHLQNRFLFILAITFYVSKWLSNKQKQIDKCYNKKLEKHYKIAGWKFDFLAYVYYLMWNPNSEASQYAAENNKDFKLNIEKELYKKVFVNIDEAIEEARKYFKTRRISISRSEFFRLNKFFMDEIVSYKELKRKVRNFMSRFTPRDKTPRFIARAKYSETNLKQVAIVYDIHYESKFKLNIQTFVHLIRHAAKTGEKLLNYTFWLRTYGNICDKTVTKALFLYSRHYMFLYKKKKRKRIPLRNYRLKQLGYCQLDLKTFTKNEYKMKCTKFYSIDIIDEASNFMYAELTTHPTADNITAFLKRALEYFKNYGISVFQIKTDSCNIFAAKAGKEHEKFKVTLLQNNIKHVLIPFQRPQHNGKVERLHKTYDDEIKFALRNKTFKECQEIIANYVDFYNFKRITNSVIRNNQYGNSMSASKYLSRKNIPIELVKSLI